MNRSFIQRLLHIAFTFVLLGNAMGPAFSQATGGRPDESRPAAELNPAAPEAAENSDPNTIFITDAGFVPQVITVTVGTEVTWINQGTKPHGVVGLTEDGMHTVYLPLIVSGTAQATSAGGNGRRAPGTVSAAGALDAQPDWASGLLQPGESYKRAFNRAGTYPYVNSEAPEITGTIVVRPPNEPPSLDIDSPAEGAIVGPGSLQVSGTVADDGQVTAVTVNGVPADVSGASFEATINLAPGNQTILAQAEDDQGAKAADTIVVLVDGQGPAVQILEPRHRQSVYTLQPFLDIVFDDFTSAVNPASFQATLQRQGQAPYDVGGDLTVSPDRAYGSLVSPLAADSAYTLTVTVEDALGNDGLATAAFYVPADPSSIQPPAEPDQAGWVSGMVYDSSTCGPDLTDCAGLAGALVTVQEVNEAALAELRAQRQSETLARLAADETFRPLGTSGSTAVTAAVTTAVSGTAVTGPDGFFAFPLAQTGVYWLRVEKDGYTYGQRELQVVRERSSTANDVYLTPIDPVVTPCDSNGCTHANSDGSILLDIPAGAIIGGESVDVTATRFDNVEFLPSGELPEGTWETYAFNLGGASEITFTVPISLQLKNELGFTAGLTIPLGYWNQNTQQWEHEGVGVVDETGQWIDTTISHFSNHDLNFPVSQSDVQIDVGGDEFDDDPICRATRKTSPAAPAPAAVSSTSSPARCTSGWTRLRWRYWVKAWPSSCATAATGPTRRK
jgi:plastocyanin